MDRVRGWLRGAGWALLGVAAVGLPVALMVAGIDAIRRSGSAVSNALLTGVFVLLGVVLVVAVERGLAWVVREQGLGTAAWTLAGLVVLAVATVLLPGLGLVLAGVLLALGIPLLLAAIGVLVWWRWRHGPRPTPRTPPPVEDVRIAAAGRRDAVRVRHDHTREAVARGFIGPGFTRGAGDV